MKGLDNLLMVNFNDSAAARAVGLEGQHGEEAASSGAVGAQSRNLSASPAMALSAWT